MPCVDPEGESQGVRTLLENHKNIGFLSNTGLDPLLNHKATKPAFNVRPPLANQGKAIYMAFPWLADDGPHIVVFGSSLPTSTKKNKKKSVKDGPPLKKLYRSVNIDICISKNLRNN